MGSVRSTRRARWTGVALLAAATVCTSTVAALFVPGTSLAAHPAVATPPVAVAPPASSPASTSVPPLGPGQAGGPTTGLTTPTSDGPAGVAPTPETQATQAPPASEIPASPLASTPLTDSPDFAGYTANVSSLPVTIQTEFVLPKVTCPSSGTFGLLPGTVVGGGSVFLGSAVELACVNGSPSYGAEAYYDGPFSSLGVTLKAGDTVKATVTDSSDASTATLSDLTTGDSGSDHFAAFSPGYASVGDDDVYDDYTTLGVPRFTPISFADSTVGGKVLRSLHPTGFGRGNGTTTVISTTALTPAGGGFTTSFGADNEPTIVQGRVIEGITHQLTESSTVWPATFTSTASTNPSSFTATVYWGNGTTSDGSISAVAPWNCTYSPLPPVGTCFAVTARHRYAAVGAHPLSVSVQGPGGPAYADGMAEIDPVTMPPATDSIGVLTWTNPKGQVQMCTATAVAGLDMVVTARHCFDSDPADDSHFEFAPQHTGYCGGSGGHPTLSLGACEASGSGHDPDGYWSGSSLSFASDSGVASGEDTAMVTLGDTSNLGDSLRGKIGGLPIHFDPPHGKAILSVQGYPGRAGKWTLESCTNEKDQSTWKDSVIGITPCVMEVGTSGSPFITSSLANVLPDSIVGTMWFVCPPGGGCTLDGSLVWPHGSSHDAAVANLMSNNSMQLYLYEVFGIQP